VKVSPNQQELILANEYRAPANSARALEDVIGLATQGTTLRRLTMIASRPNAATIWVRADYGLDVEAVNDPILAAASDVDEDAPTQDARVPTALIADTPESRARALTARARSQSSQGRAAYYARVQAPGERSKGLYVDVHV